MTGGNLFWLAPLLPLAVFVLLAAGLSRYRRLAAGSAVAALLLSFVLSLLGLFATAGGARLTSAVPWLSVGGRRVALALWLDPLAALAATLVAAIALLVLVYSIRYMAGDPNVGRFFAELSLFAGAMLTLVLAADLFTLFIAWELVGISSYLLIGFWFDRPGVPAAATKAFLVTRLGDLAMLLGVLLLVAAAGSGSIATVLAMATNGKLSSGHLIAAALLLFAGAAGKSAQIPFQGWLPDAMLGPTPVSALLHSATMVAAGVFLVARLYPLFLVAGPALTVVAWVGALSALLGAGAALVQTDLKRTLAYSTISQLGLMYVGLGAGSLLAGMLLLVGQALYKSLLFLAAGAVEHAVGSRDFARMGGLARRMPYTFAAFLIGTVALSGLPILVALPVKDPALAAAWQHNLPVFWLALLASMGTALYSGRTLAVVFWGNASPSTAKAGETSGGMLAPLLILAALVLVGLNADAPLFGRPLGRLLGIATPDSTPVALLTLGIALAGVGFALWARRIWPQAVVWPPLEQAAPALRGELGLVATYRALAAAGVHLAFAIGAFDHSVFDALAGGMARGTLDLVRASDRFDRTRLDAAVASSGDTLLGLGQRVRAVQTGRIENYLLAIFVWGLAIVALALIGGGVTGR
ncbi:MAG: NADH-quinone oxidoreductase subunit 5 family protein [Chloroflexota bacterium]